MEIRSEAEKVDDTNFSGIPFAEGGRRPVLPVCLRNMKTGINEVLEYTVAQYYYGPVIVENPPTTTGSRGKFKCTIQSTPLRRSRGWRAHCKKIRGELQDVPCPGGYSNCSKEKYPAL